MKEVKKTNQFLEILSTGKITKDATNTSDVMNLLTLKEILLSKPKANEVETYTMQPELDEEGIQDTSLIVNRMPLLFDD